MKVFIQISILLFCLAMLSGIALAEINAEYTQTVEDTDIMAAVIDRTMEKAFPEEYKESGFFDAGCQGVFLKSYGVLFTMNVGFPVMKPPEEKKTQEAKPDDLWEQTRREVMEQGGLTGSGYGSTLNVKPFDSYDQAKVERLRNELLKQIGDYGNNIRNLGTDDSITIVIRGRKNPMSPDFFSVPKYEIRNTGTAVVVPRIATSVTVPSEPGVVTESAGVVAAPPPTVPSPPALPSDTTSTSVPEQQRVAATLEAQKAKEQAYNAQKEAQRANEEIYKVQKEVQEAPNKVQQGMGKTFTYTGIYPNQMFTRGSKTTMIISVKKRSVMDLKEGRISFDEFAKRVEITQY